MLFLDFSLSTLSLYDEVLRGLRSQEDPKTLLDVGCCFGHDLRKLVADGAPSSQIVGAELRSEFIELGYDLFKDRDTYEGKFVVGDIVADSPGSPTEALKGTIDFLHVSAFLHIFGWDRQLQAAIRLMAFLKNKRGTVVLGHQIGSSKPGEYPHPASSAGVTFLHSQETFRKLWNEVEKQTATEWQLKSSMRTLQTKGSTFEVLYFEIIRIK